MKTGSETPVTRTAYVAKLANGQFEGQRRYSYKEGTTHSHAVEFKHARIFYRPADAEQYGEPVPVTVTLE